MEFNFIDLAIIISILYFSVSGYFHGFIRVTLDIFSLVASFLIAYNTHKFATTFLEKYGISQDFSAVIAFFVIWSFVMMAFYFLFQLIYVRIPETIRKSKLNRMLGVAPASLKGFFVTAVFLLIIISLPFTSKVKDFTENSFLGKPIASKTGFLEQYVSGIFKDIAKATEMKIIKPGSDETVELGYKVFDSKIDEESEEKMLELLNKEREANGLKALSMDNKIQKVARKHSTDMFEKGYFSHTNKEGKDPFDRLKAGLVEYFTAGENLALAPDVYMAHKGLMESPGHRANILTAEFEKVGIGVIDGGRYGKMFTQNFSD